MGIDVPELDMEAAIDLLLQATSDRVQQQCQKKSQANNDQRSRCACPGNQKSSKDQYTSGIHDHEQSGQEMAESRAFERYLC